MAVEPVLLRMKLEDLTLKGEKEKKRKDKKRRKSTPVATVEDVSEVGLGSGGESRKKKRKKEKILITSQTVEDVDEAGLGSGEESRKKKRKKEESLITSQTVEDVDEAGLGSGGELLRRKRKKERIPTISRTVEEVDEAGIGSGGKSLRKKKEEEENLTTSLTVGNFDEAGLGRVRELLRKKRKERSLTTSQTIEEVDEAGIGSGGKSLRKAENLTNSLTVDEAGLGSGGESLREKRKSEKNLTTLQIVEDANEAGLGSGGESLRKKRKKDKNLTTLQIVEDVNAAEIGSAREPRRKKKKKLTTSETVEDVDGGGMGSGREPRRKKEKKLTTSETVEDVGEGGKGGGMEPLRKDKKLANSETIEEVDEGGKGSGREPRRKKDKKFSTSKTVKDVVQGGGGKSRRKEKKLATSQTLEDCRTGTGTATKSILAMQQTPTGNGSESVRKKKRVTFQLPLLTQDIPSRDELRGGQTEAIHSSIDLEVNPWVTDSLRLDLVYGAYTPLEDGALKQAIFDYIQEQGWDREEGLQKILNCRNSEARGCWRVIRKCLPQRGIKRLYTRAHRLFDPGNYLGKWTPEEAQSLMELHSVHGNKWKKISTIIGRDASNCKDKWRYLKISGSNGRKSGLWSAEEQQKLCALVMKCLHVRKQMAQKGQLRKHHKVVRDEINWEFIAEKMDGRNRLDCMTQWYDRLASPMVTSGDWSNGDDQLLLERLMEEFPLSEDLVEWDSLLEHRSGEVCKRRWEQMQRPLGREPALRHLHFLEKLEGVVTRFAPHLADPEYDPEFAAALDQADANESEFGVDT